MAVAKPLDAGLELLEEFERGCRVSEYLVEVLPVELWHAEAPGKGRTIAAIAAHMQSIRRMFAKMGGAEPVPASLDRFRCTPEEAIRAMQQSSQALGGLFRSALEGGRARVKGMPRRAVNMMVYLIQHDAHHRGQICMLARHLGHRLSKDEVMRIWGWKKLP